MSDNGSNLQLLSKSTVGGQELKNRIVLAPMTRARCDDTEDPFDVQSTLPNDLMRDYYAQRSSGGLLITEGTHFSEESSGWRNAPWISSERHAEAWKKVVDAVHEKGGIIYVQLWHLGRQCHSSHHPTKKRIVSASNLPMQGSKVKTINREETEPEVPHSLSVDEIKETVQDFAAAAKFASMAGFDGVEIHSANGYLIDQFLQSSSNKRTDEYGGSVENRTRILREVVEAIVESEAYPANRIGFRLSPNGGFGGMGSEDNFETFVSVARIMNQYGLAYLHLMDGLGFGFHNKDKIVKAADIRKVFDGPIIVNVGLTRDTAEGMIRSGAADLAAFGRLYISNPDLPKRFANGWKVEPEAAYEHWFHATGAKGYTDWPTYSPDDEQKDA